MKQTAIFIETTISWGYIIYGVFIGSDVVMMIGGVASVLVAINNYNQIAERRKKNKVLKEAEKLKTKKVLK